MAYNAKERPSVEEEDFVLYVMESYYSPVILEHYNWFTYENYLSVLDILEMSSSPGIGFSKEAPTIGDWLKFDGINYDRYQVAELWSRVRYLYEMEEIDSIWKTFIKVEPHKVSKMETKRWRLIMACPLDCQVLWHMVFAKQNHLEVIHALEIPSAQGITIPYGGWRLHYQQWNERKLLCGSDKSAWDWTVSGWMLDLDLRFRQRIIHTDDDWLVTARKLYKNAFGNTLIQLSDGRRFRQMHPGVMKSGCVNTISTNSHAQVFLHILYSLRKGISIEPMLVAVGDDTLQAEEHIQDLELYESFGVKIKTVSTTLEFVGREWSDEGMMPMYTSKHLFSIMYKSDDLIPEILDAYAREYVNIPEYFQFWYELARVLGYPSSVHSRAYYKYWLDNPDAKFGKPYM